MNKKIVIIGGGPAGVEAALEAIKGGTTVILVSDGPIGGRAGWHSLLPSKVWLLAADTVGLLDDIDESADRKQTSLIPVSGVIEQIAHVKQNWNLQMAAALDNGGVDVIKGTASFANKKEIEVRDNDGDVVQSLEADAFIVASGSVPIFPPGLEPDGKRVIAPRFASHLNVLPQSMIIIGAGPTGCESAYLFNRFGVKVTWIVDQFGILPQMHRDLGYFLGMKLEYQGVGVIQGNMVKRLERDNGVTAVLADGARHCAEMAFVAIGRKPDWASLNLTAAGLVPEPSGEIAVDGFGRTENKGIYLVGDAAGGALIANKAMAQARIAARHAAGADVKIFDPDLITQVTYTNPQAAQIGNFRNDKNRKSVRVPFSASLKTHLIGDSDGFIDLFFNASDRRILGAVALGSHAADVLTPVAVALKLRATVDQLADIYAPHPSIGELLFIAAREA